MENLWEVERDWKAEYEWIRSYTSSGQYPGKEIDGH